MSNERFNEPKRPPMTKAQRDNMLEVERQTHSSGEGIAPYTPQEADEAEARVKSIAEDAYARSDSYTRPRRGGR